MVRILTLLWIVSILAACGGGDDAPNVAPTVTSTGFTLDQDTSLSVTLTASDPENATVRFAKTGDPARGQILTFAENGAFTYRPNAGFAGTDRFTISASDGTNAVTATITLTVNPRSGGGGNDAPTVTSTDFTLDRDTDLSETLTASDPENEPVRFTKTADPTQGRILAFAENGAFTYRPNAGFIGTDRFTISASDGTNAVTATITLTVRGANGAPSVTSASFTLVQDTELSQTLTASDPESEPVRFTKTADPTQGAIVTFAEDGAFTYRPNEGFVGTDSFTVSASDGTNAVTGTIALTVKAKANGAPTVTSASFTLDQDTQLSQTLTASDPENEPVTFTKTSDPAHGEIVTFAENGAFAYRPNAGFVGADSFTVSASDGTNEVPATITLDVKVPLPGSGPAVTLDFALRQVTLSWDAVTDATFYRVLKNPDNRSGHAQIGEDLPVTAFSDTIGVHVTDWVNTSYIVQACNAGGCVGSAAQFLVQTDSPKAVGYFKASNTEGGEGGDNFGGSVSLSGDGNTLAVGASFESSAARGVNGDQGDNSASSAGAVYVFTRRGSTWEQQAYLKASNTEAGDRFGQALSLSGDGNTLAVGAFGESSAARGVNGDERDNSASLAGAVYVFTRNGSIWEQQAYVKASNTEAGDRFGQGSLSLSGDGNTLAVGAFGEDSAARDVNGNQSGNTAVDAGAVYVFARSGSIWEQQAYVKASNTGAGDFFGVAVSLSGDGNTLAVGAPDEDSAGRGVNADQSDNTARDAGAVYVFARSGSTWSQKAYLKATNTEAFDQFGSSLGLSGDGNTLAVGAFGEDSAAVGVDAEQSDNSAAEAGAVYVFTRSGSTWEQQAYVKALNAEPEDSFGDSVSLSGDGSTLAVGAIGEDSSATGVDGNRSGNSARNAGAVYVFARSGNTWSQQNYVKASNTGRSDFFGDSLGLSGDGDTLAVGAFGEDSAAIGVNGDQSNNTAREAGAVYLY